VAQAAVISRDGAVRRSGIDIAGVELELREQGGGRPILFLHPGIGLLGSEPVLAALARHGRVLAPSHPGFGASALPADFRTVDDLAYFYLDFLDALDLRDVVLVGAGFGGWIAAELAIKSTERLSHLALVDPVGIKVGDRESRDIVDIYAHTADQVAALAFHAPARRPDIAGLDDAALREVARNRESLALFAWSPYMHDPRLRRRLRRIRIPTLLVWGESDRIVTPDYGRAFAAEIPGARFAVLAEAGHYPHIEQPEALVQEIAGFVAASAEGIRAAARN
jgi:pimeloyl-ACP methyl ester carboxylesterase